ncbi:hypothetical protein [Streptomyces uncialis]|uniref:hypothetical protein n=1 Tax=Streptomyces uncialis TaxID=1048205 RepID=UPI000ABE9C9A|nr:hypothetical protein [Streptomyces uncialis]
MPFDAVLIIAVLVGVAVLVLRGINESDEGCGCFIATVLLVAAVLVYIGAQQG